MVYTNDCFPPLPAALRSCDKSVAFNMLMQSTSKPTSVISEDALHKKAKKDVTSILKFMGEWCRECPSEGRPAAQFIPSEPPSGTDRDHVFIKILQKQHRVEQCSRIYKLRVAKSNLPENTPEVIRSALLSYNYAKRGITLEEERVHRQRDVPDDPENVVYQVHQETDAGFCASDSSEDDAESQPAPSLQPRAQPTATTQPAYHEIPFPEPYYHPLEFCFRYGFANDTVAAFTCTRACVFSSAIGTSPSSQAMDTKTFPHFIAKNGPRGPRTPAGHMEEQHSANAHLCELKRLQRHLNQLQRKLLLLCMHHHLLCQWELQALTWDLWQCSSKAV